jgi:hypothetical protein
MSLAKRDGRRDQRIHRWCSLFNSACQRVSQAGRTYE